VTISERIAAARRERRVLARVSRAAWRLEQAERERTWALVPARAEGISIRILAAAAGLSPSRVHQLAADAGLDALAAALGELRAADWPAPEDPDNDEDADPDGRDHLADRLSDEVRGR
jgi:DNA-binding PucR family transcriptional regulator